MIRNGVAASPQYGVDKQTDAFFVGTNGQLHVAWVSGAGNWNGPIGLGAAGLFPPGAAVAASPQYGVDKQTDVFAIGNNGQLHVAWVSGAGNWNGPIGIVPPPQITIAIQQDGQGRFVKVDGTNFTLNGDVIIDYSIRAGSGPTTTTTGQTSSRANASGGISARINITLTGVTGAAVKATDLSSQKSAVAQT